MNFGKKHIAYKQGHIALFKTVLCVVIMLGSTFSLSGQAVDNWRDILEKRLQSESTVDFLQLSGYLNNSIFSRFQMAFDDEHWVGILYYPELGKEYRLEGGKDNERILLLEYDGDDQHIGYWIITKELERYNARWRNLEGSMDHEFELFDELWNTDIEKDYAKKIEYFRGLQSATSLEFEIEKELFKISNVKVFDHFLNRYYAVEWQCKNKSCSLVDIQLEGKDGQLIIEPDQVILVSASDSLLFTKKYQRKTKRRSKIEDQYFFSIEYPLIDQKEAANRIENDFENINSALIFQLNELTKQQSVENRFSYFAHAWFDIYFWNEEQISGKWIVQKNWEKEIESYAFNYSIRNKKDIDLRRQFKTGFDIEFFLDHVVEDQKKNIPEYRNLLIRNKIQQLDFPYINFTKEGLVLSTEFDTVFGPFEITIPFDVIDEYLRKRSELKRIMERRDEY